MKGSVFKTWCGSEYSFACFTYCQKFCLYGSFDFVVVIFFLIKSPLNIELHVTCIINMNQTLVICVFMGGGGGVAL